MGILFLCVANSARSQMAEGLAKNILGNTYHIFSAGSNPTFVHPLAIKVMLEIGVDIRKQYSKPITTIDLSQIDIIITLCKDEICPYTAAKAKHEHWPLPDPVASDAKEEKQLEQFCNVRDALIKNIRELKTNLDNSTKPLTKS